MDSYRSGSATRESPWRCPGVTRSVWYSVLRFYLRKLGLPALDLEPWSLLILELLVATCVTVQRNLLFSSL